VTGLEHPPAFLYYAHRIPENVKHAGTDDPLEGLRFEPQVGRIPHFKMDSFCAPGPEGIGSGHANENAAQIDPYDSDMRGTLHHLNGEVAGTCPKVKEKTLMERGKDFLGNLTVISLDDESGSFFIKRSQRSGNPLDGESPGQIPLCYAFPILCCSLKVNPSGFFATAPPFNPHPPLAKGGREWQERDRSLTESVKGNKEKKPRPHPDSLPCRARVGVRRDQVIA